MTSALGAVTSLGVGSGLELQNMLDQFRKIDEGPITGMKDEISTIKERLTKFDEVSSKLLTIKSHALNLSLASNFMSRKATVSDDSIASATAVEGASETTNALKVVRLATRSSWQTAGVSSAATSVYIPTLQNATTGFDNTNHASAVAQDGVLALRYGSGDGQHSIGVSLTAGMTLDQMVNAINTDTENNNGAGGTYLTASTYAGTDGKHYLRIASTAAGSTETNRVTVLSSPEGLAFEAPKVSFSIQVGSAAPSIIEVAADTTFNELAEQINTAVNNPGVTAAIINDGTATAPYHLAINANNTGEENRIVISGIQMTEIQGAGGASLNAELSLDGLTYQRQANANIKDIIQGVTLNLNKEGETTVSVSGNHENIRKDIIGLVETYNEVVQDINAASTYDSETGEFGILAQSTMASGLPNDLSNVIGAVTGATGSIRSLYDLGMAVNQDGTITINQDLLDSALSTDSEGVADLFLGDPENGVTGLADQINEHLSLLTGSQGMIDLEKNYGQDQITRLQDNIDSATERLDRKYDLMALQFAALDQYAGTSKSLSNYLTTVFDSLQSSNNNK